MDEVLRLTADMTLEPPASKEAIADTERGLGMRFPRDYVEFLLLHNGGEGPVGREGWARFWRVEDLVNVTDGYDLDPIVGWLLFGTDGGGEAFLFDEGGQVMEMPFIADARMRSLRVASSNSCVVWATAPPSQASDEPRLTQARSECAPLRSSCSRWWGAAPPAR